MADVVVYGADDCKDTKRTRSHLDELGVEYKYEEVNRNREADAFVRAENDGDRKTPTLVLRGDDGEDILSVPSDTELDAALQEHDLLPLSDRGDGSPGLGR